MCIDRQRCKTAGEELTKDRGKLFLEKNKKNMLNQAWTNRTATDIARNQADQSLSDEKKRLSETETLTVCSLRLETKFKF